MEFSENTANLMEIFMNDFESKYFHLKTPSERSIFDRIIKKMYADISTAEVGYNDLIKRKHITMKKKILSENFKLPATNLLSSSYVPGEIYKSINKDAIAMIEYNVKLGDNKLNIYFLLFKESDLLDIHKYDKRIKFIIMWFYVAFAYAKKSYGKKINLFLYLTTKQKILPKNKLTILGAENCNTAVTTACETNGDILIFREEEWFKVLIHETFHLLCLDFANMPNYILSEFNKKIREIIPVKSEYNLYEAYSEFWATIWNCAFCSYNIIDTNNFTNFASYMDYCVQIETIFAIFQMNKVLRFMGLSYSQLYIKDETANTIARRYLYREKTNVLAYYIVKTMLLFNHVDFLNWCDRNNGLSIIQFRNTRLNLMEFARFIEQKYKNHNFLAMVSDINKLFGNITIKKVELLKTMRMTACEWKE